MARRGDARRGAPVAGVGTWVLTPDAIGPGTGPPPTRGPACRQSPSHSPPKEGLMHTASYLIAVVLGLALTLVAAPAPGATAPCSPIHSPPPTTAAPRLDSTPHR